MKPDNAKQLAVQMDLSEVALEDALLLISPTLGEGINYGWISIPSQLLGTAVLLTKYSNFIELSFPNIHLSIEINPEYDCDEWSVMVNNWDFSKEKPENNSVTVWSSGA